MTASLRLVIDPIIAVLCACILPLTAPAAEVIPKSPDRYVNDYAGVLSPGVEQRLNRQLEELEKSDSTQIVVAIFRKMESDSSIEDYTVRVAERWKVGGKAKDNGAVLFIFVEDRKMFIQVGYGLEGAIPDATAKNIIDSQIRPEFRRNDFNAGVTAGVAALIQAARGEYTGAGRTAAQRGSGGRGNSFLPFALIVLFFLFVASTRRRGYAYGRRGRTVAGPIFWGGSGWGGGFGRSSGGWGGGGFSGGGGRFGGGGAGGSW